MFDSTTLMTYLAASILIILAPGPAQALVLARSISNGKKIGIITVFGLNASAIVHTTVAAIGLSAVLATSALAFTVVKYLGAAYLFYLGFKELLSREQPLNVAYNTTISSTKAFSTAFFTGVLNPKVSLFYLTFIPQFIDTRRGFVFFQFLVLGGMLAFLDILYESLLVIIIHKMGGWITQNQKFASWRKKITGGVFIALGMRLIFVEKN